MKPFEIAGLPSDEVKNFVGGTHSDPFRVLGPHSVGEDLEIRVFRPDARKIEIVLDRDPEEPIAAQKIKQDGFFYATVLGATRDLTYNLRVTAWEGSQDLTRDPYQYGPIMGEVDLHLFAEGQHWKITKSSAHICAQSAMRQAFISQSGRRTRNASAWLAISTVGMAG